MNLQRIVLQRIRLALKAGGTVSAVDLGGSVDITGLASSSTVDVDEPLIGHSGVVLRKQ